jgi:hypothetical protein
MRIPVLAPREVGLMLVGMLVPRLTFLALREVAAPLIVDARVAALLALREVAAMVLLEGVSFLLLALRKASVLIMLSVIVSVLSMVVTVVVTVIVVGMIAHARVSQRYV